MGEGKGSRKYTVYLKLERRVENRRRLKDREFYKLEDDLYDFYKTIELQYKCSKHTGFQVYTLRHYRNKTFNLLIRVFGSRKAYKIKQNLNLDLN